MGTRGYLLVLSAVACGSSPPLSAPPREQRVNASPPASPTPSAPALTPPPAQAPVPAFDRAALPTWTPVPRVAKAPATEPITVFAVDTNGDWLLRDVAPNKKATNYVFASTGKRLTGQLQATETSDAFATIAGVLGVTVEPVKAKGKGAFIDVDFVAAPFADLVRLVADVGRVNVVVAPGAVPSLNVHLQDFPWDQALDLFIKAAGLTYTREGNTYYVVPPGTKLAAAAKVPGSVLDIDANGASVAQVVAGVRALGTLPAGSCSPTKVTLRLKHAGVGAVAKALEVASGEKLSDATACPARPLDDEPIKDLKLVAIVAQGIKRVAVFDNHGQTVVGTRDGKRIKDIGSFFVTSGATGKSP